MTTTKDALKTEIINYLQGVGVSGKELMTKALKSIKDAA
jgi:hypothetical protein